MFYGKLYPKPPAKHLSAYRRNWAKANGLVLTGRNRNMAHECAFYMKMLKMEIMAGWRMVKAKRIGKRQVLKLQQMYKFLFVTMVRELAVPIDVHTYPLPRQPRGPSATIDGWDEIRIPEDLRMHTRENLRRLFDGFQFPDKFVSKGRNVFTGEEVFLFGLYRLSHVSKYN